MFNSKLKAKVEKLEGQIEMQDANLKAVLATMKDVFKDVQDEQRRIVSNITVGDSEILNRIKALESETRISSDLWKHLWRAKEENDKRRKASRNRKASKAVSGRHSKTDARKPSVKVRNRAVKKAVRSSRQLNKACEG